jgi:hypothetical protein
MVSYEERCKVFEKELALIIDDSVREFTKLCLLKCPDYVFTNCPASSTGKFHPLDELGWDGTLIHTKKMFTVAYELCKALGCEANRDEILSACIVHDLLKQGVERTGHTVNNHPDLAAELVIKIYKDTQMLTPKSYSMIKNCVGFHYGLWSTDKWKKDLSEYTAEEMCVYLSDYIASKRFVAVDYRR